MSNTDCKSPQQLDAYRRRWHARRSQPSSLPWHRVDGISFRAAGPARLPEHGDGGFVGRGDLLAECARAWGLDENYGRRAGRFPRPFRLVGDPGVGKNALVYELVRRVNAARQAGGEPPLPFYMIQGHEEMTPEDLALSLVPADVATFAVASPGDARFVLQASGLVTALHEGGIVFFDEINRVPPRSLSLLVSALDERSEVFSAMTSTWIGRPAGRRMPFLFCSAMNPGLGEGTYPLPENIRQRTLPAIPVDPMKLPETMVLIRRRVAQFGADVDFAEIAELLERHDKTLRSSRETLALFDDWLSGTDRSVDALRRRFEDGSAPN